MFRVRHAAGKSVAGELLSADQGVGTWGRCKPASRL
jgi:hypothetical protein